MHTARSSTRHRGSPPPPQSRPPLPPEQAPPSIPPRAGTPPGVGTLSGQIPLNFLLGYGPGPDPPQLLPWLWAWTRSLSTSPLGGGLETYKACWDTTPSPHPTPQKPAARHAEIPPAMHVGIAPPPPMNRSTDACENITLPQLRCGR